MRRMGILLTIGGLLGLAGPGVVAAAERPDMVIFLADDLGWMDCSPVGAPRIDTPNMARLAADGMTFTHAFVASPSCAPSRGALLTGLDPMRNGAMRNHSRPRKELKTWPDYFHDLGYEVAAIGKTAHYAQVTTYGFDHVSHYNYHQDDCVEAAVAWLAQRESKKPLCLLVGTNWSHVPWPRDKDSKPIASPPPTPLVDTPEMRQALAWYDAAVANADRDLGLVYDAARKELGKDTFFLFTSDHGAQLPFGKWNVYDSGVRTPLIVAWPGHIDPGARTDAMVSWIDILPTCLQAAGGEPPKGLSGRSFLAVLEGQTDQFRDHIFLTHSGDGNMNTYPSRAVRTRRWKYIRNLDPEGEFHSHIDQGKASSDGRSYWDSWVERAKTDPLAAAVVHRYHHRESEELYDLEADPLELKNLADD
ncbi:MAG TPA: sulfatase, partial [Isosphaeraceae bacterium]|nr:sulfatase [Isosphaeraceae bacterium]